MVIVSCLALLLTSRYISITDITTVHSNAVSTSSNFRDATVEKSLVATLGRNPDSGSLKEQEGGPSIV